MEHSELMSELLSRVTIGLEVVTLILVAFFLRAFLDHRGYGQQRAVLTESDQLSSAISLSVYLCSHHKSLRKS